MDITIKFECAEQMTKGKDAYLDDLFKAMQEIRKLFNVTKIRELSIT